MLKWEQNLVTRERRAFQAEEQHLQMSEDEGEHGVLEELTRGPSGWTWGRKEEGWEGPVMQELWTMSQFSPYAEGNRGATGAV